MHHPDSLIEHIAKFTSQRDEDLLTFSMLKSIKGMMSSAKAHILTCNAKGLPVSQMVYEEDDCLVLEDHAAIQQGVQEAIDFMQSGASDEYIITSNEGATLIRMLKNEPRGMQLLMIELASHPSKAQSYILSGILSIYKNFNSLLSESQTDALTGLANRKTFESAITKMFEGQKLPVDVVNQDEQKQSLDTKRIWIAIVDIDHFKKVNDTFGHIYGDEILIQMAQLIRASFRDTDLLFRFGGEEFVIVVEASDNESCRDIIEKFRLKVASHHFPRVEQVTISAGVVELKKNTFYVTSIDYADQALYYSKKNGRNQINFFEDLLASGDVKVPEVSSGDIELF